MVFLRNIHRILIFKGGDQFKTKLRRIGSLCLYLLLLTSCAKVQYICEQGLGQISILNNGIDNEVVLNDPNVPIEQKNKIKKIEEYKKYFFEYFNKPSGKIYSKTTFLKTKAVSHMVVVSPFNKVEAENECFPMVGCFPYISFFKERRAKEYADQKIKEGYVTYIRPVYAYSTLNYFTDTILSSFFEYGDDQLAELIFHELFHTLFFIKGDVDMSENLAQYFGEELQYEYFKLNGEEKIKRIEGERKNLELRALVIDKIKELNILYQTQHAIDLLTSSRILKEFLVNNFNPAMENKCSLLNITKEKCYPLKVDWDNARFAAFMTYEKNLEKIRKLHQQSGKNLKAFYEHLVFEYDRFKEQSEKGSFAQYLFE